MFAINILNLLKNYLHDTKKNLRTLHSVSSMSLYLGSIPEILQTTVADILKHSVGGGESRAMRKKNYILMSQMKKTQYQQCKHGKLHL